MKQAEGNDTIARVRRQPKARRSVSRRIKIARILVPVDFSEAALKAIDYAVWLAADTNAKIILMHVIEPVYVASSYPATAYVPQNSKAEEKASHDRLLTMATKSIPPKLYDKAIVRLGTPYHEITTAARNLKAGLIVITTHGRTGLSHVLMGSTAERVVRHAPCPVLTVRRPE